jgi:Leucine-rich repeat (LRR) protein
MLVSVALCGCALVGFVFWEEQIRQPVSSHVPKVVISHVNLERLVPDGEGRLNLPLSIREVLDDSTLKGLVEKFPQIETLDLSFAVKITEQGFSELGKLTHLRSLSLAYSEIAGDPFVSFAPEHDLETIDLSSAKVDAQRVGAGLVRLTNLKDLRLSHFEDPDSLLKALGAHPNIASLSLDFSSKLSVEGLRKLALLPRLTKLSLRNIPLGQLEMEAIGAVHSLEELDLTWTGVRDLHGLEGLTKLKSLRLWGNELSPRAPEDLLRFPKLTRLSLHNCRLHENEALLTALESLKALEELDLGGNFLTEKTLAVIPDLRSLTLPAIEGQNSSAWAALRSRAKLAQLELEGASTRSEVLEELISFSALQELTLVEGPIFSRERARLLAQIPNLTSFWLVRTEWEDGAIETLGKSDSIREVQLLGGPMKSDRIPRAIRFKDLCRNGRLTKFRLPEPISLESFDDLSSCAFLTSLSVNVGNTTSTIPPGIAALPKLERLSLSGKALNEAALNDLSNLPSLKELMVWADKITPEAVDKFLIGARENK